MSIPHGRVWIAVICTAIILASLGQVAARSCTLARSTNTDQRFAVCMVRLP